MKGTNRIQVTGDTGYHVVDLAHGHLAELRYLANSNGVLTVNVGTGQDYSVLEMVRAFERVSGCPVPYQIFGRRAGDIAKCYADPGLAERLLGWKANKGIEEMCADTWRWQKTQSNEL